MNTRMDKHVLSKKMIDKFAVEAATDYQKTDKLSYVKIQNGIVCPLKENGIQIVSDDPLQYGGICDSNLNFVKESLTKRVSPLNFTAEFQDWFVGFNPALDPTKIALRNEDVIFIGAMPSHYGHFITEGLSRLWLLLESDFEKMKCVYIGDNNEEYLQILSLFGINNFKLEKITIPTRFKSILIPEQSIRLHDYYHINFKRTIDKVMKSIIPSEYKHVYFSKKNIGNGRAFGQDVIENVLRINGYSVFDPKNLTINQVLSIMKGCEVFAASSGTNIHNSIFMLDNSRCICFNRSSHFHPLQIMIDRMRNLNCTYVDSYVDLASDDWSGGPFLFQSNKNLINFYDQEKYKYNKFFLCIYSAKGTIDLLLYKWKSTIIRIFFIPLRYFFHKFIKLIMNRSKR